MKKIILTIAAAFIVSASAVAQAPKTTVKKDTTASKPAYQKTVTVSLEIYQYLIGQVASKKDLLDYVPNEMMPAEDKVSNRKNIDQALMAIGKQAKLDSVKVQSPVKK